ncbi:MAG: succinate dehydrogenase assembly factor 2 [Alphaproteobacteria bacterium]|nr:succinate dehydrogenase assembly factor 2 [Alphaproteobacteria bacterium]
MTDDLEAARKRLSYRAHHRGTKEMDLILGPFADLFLPGYDATKLARFEAVLDQSDADLLSWVTGQSPLGQGADIELLGEVVAFAHKGLAK